ncbi:hypothetical protein D9757_011526 [Collybiopsis confluens]|uniref:Uncharacterized protein n=1 Tax=Collybiopsis confluens TaxID=2823264 RepID=A0A8H5H7A7_9AGAR|nr:hypothetical protein D9757_011526 [Collybiopsis confluens]
MKFFNILATSFAAVLLATPTFAESDSAFGAGVKDGLFCGDGKFNCLKGYVYQCGGGGTLACVYGLRDDCPK